MNMKKWIDTLRESKIKKSMPILSFPCINLMNISINDLVNSSSLQAEGMKKTADAVDSLASVSMMDLSVEAEAFGSEIKFSENEVPSVTGAIVSSYEDAEKLTVPEVGTKRTGIYIDAIKKASGMITDRPVFAGVIGPFSLSGRLMDVTEALIYCYTEPETVKLTMEKVTEFLIKYIKAYKDAGANGVVMAEPLTGLLSPALAEEFSEPYVKKIIEEVQTDDFIVIYHNCGDNVIGMIDSILNVNAAAYHFGNAVSMYDIMERVPSDVIAMGNIDPVGEFCDGTPETIREAVLSLMNGLCNKYQNFIISSGCDIPHKSKWENIHAYFDAVEEFYSQF